MRLVQLDGLVASQGTHEQYIDPDTGTAWICTSLSGWRTAPARRTRHTPRTTSDGATRSAAYRDVRGLMLEGRFFPRDAVQGAVDARLVTGLCPDPGERYPLHVDEADQTLVAYVEQGDEIVCDPVREDALWDFQIPLLAADPYRYAAQWVSATSEGTGLDGTGGIDFTSPGPSFAAPGLAMGTSPSPIECVVRGIGTYPLQLVYQVLGPTSGVQIVDQDGTSVIGLRGQVAAGESVFVNASALDAFDVPGALVPVPAYSAVIATQSARSAVWATSYPVVRPGEVHRIRMSGAIGAGAALIVHARGVY